MLERLIDPEEMNIKDLSIESPESSADDFELEKEITSADYKKIEQFIEEKRSKESGVGALEAAAPLKSLNPNYTPPFDDEFYSRIQRNLEAFLFNGQHNYLFVLEEIRQMNVLSPEHSRVLQKEDWEGLDKVQMVSNRDLYPEKFARVEILLSLIDPQYQAKISDELCLKLLHIVEFTVTDGSHVTARDWKESAMYVAYLSKRDEKFRENLIEFLPLFKDGLQYMRQREEWNKFSGTVEFLKEAYPSSKRESVDPLQLPEERNF